VWNLIGISQQRTLSSLSPAWIQAHGQAQIFGWIGSFILGIGFYSLTKMQSTLTFPVRAGWASWGLWTLGIALRWIGGVTGWQWRILLPLSGMLQLIAFLLFYRSVRRHRLVNPAHRIEPWMVVVMAATIAFLVAVVANFAALTHLALYGDSPALPHVFDQQLVVLAAGVCRIQETTGRSSSGRLRPQRCRCARGLRRMAAHRRRPISVGSFVGHRCAACVGTSRPASQAAACPQNISAFHPLNVCLAGWLCRVF
jgi:hypothetical protein